MDYALSIVVATHPESDGAMEISKKYIANGASPRAAQAIVKTAKARAFLEGRFNVSVEDLKLANNLTSNLLRVGQVLKIPVEEKPETGNYTVYMVKSGDTIFIGNNE